jgi:hypothetical protein
MSEKRESKREKRIREEGGTPSLPMDIAIGWVEQSDGRKDIVDLAKGYIDGRFTAKDAAWYAVQPFMGGWFWEVHEGGPGKGYLGPIIEEMTANQGGEYWVPASANKVLKIMMRDGKPFPIILSESESLKVRNSGQAPLIARSRMTRFASRGTGMFVFGASLAGASLVYMLTTMGFYLSVWQPGPMVRAVDLAQMPHSQWSKVESTGPEEIISKLEMKAGVWQQPEKRKHIIPELEKERQNGREINASFDKQSFGFEAKQVGGKLEPQTEPAATEATAPAIQSPNVKQEPATPAPVVAPTAPAKQTPQSATLPTVPAPKTTAPTTGTPAADPGVERQQRVMEQLRQLRERNAAAQRQATDAAKVDEGDASSPTNPAPLQPAAPAKQPSEPSGAKK